MLAISNHSKLGAYLQLMRLDRPIGWLLLLWPTLWALWVASSGFPESRLLIVFVLGVLLTRSAGCIVNDFADRGFDGAVERTKNRPLVTSRVSVREAVLLATGLFLAAFILVLQLNVFTIELSVVALLLASIYPFLKRVTHLPQIWLGVAFAWGIPMAFAATQNELPWQAWYLFATTLVWIVAYDAMYAMVDREDDLQIGVKSIAILFGSYDVLIIGVLQVVVLMALLMFGVQMNYNFLYYLALTVATGLVIYQICLIKPRQPAQCFKAFLNNNWLGVCVFIGIALQ